MFAKNLLATYVAIQSHAPDVSQHALRGALEDISGETVDKALFASALLEYKRFKMDIDLSLFRKKHTICPACSGPKGMLAEHTDGLHQVFLDLILGRVYEGGAIGLERAPGQKHCAALPGPRQV